MENAPLASRLAERFRLLITITGGAAALIVVLDLLTSLIPSGTIVPLAIVVAVPAIAMFLCATCDMRFQRAVSALNAELRTQVRESGKGVFPWVGDRALKVVLVCLIVASLAAGMFRNGPAVALGFAAFFLVFMANVALAVRGYPTDRFFPMFD